MEFGTASGPAPCELDWKGDKYTLIFMHMYYTVTRSPVASSPQSAVPFS